MQGTHRTFGRSLNKGSNMHFLVQIGKNKCIQLGVLKAMLCVILVLGCIVTYLLSTYEVDEKRELKLAGANAQPAVHDRHCHGATCMTVSSCQVIHVAVVCEGHDLVHNVVVLVKSILLHRNNPLHLHFVSDKLAAPILKTLFTTWNVPAVDVSVYLAEEAKRQITLPSDEDILSTKDLLKATLPSLLPSDVTQVIVLDPNMVILTDIAALWVQFITMNSDCCAAIGLVENSSSQDVQTDEEEHTWDHLFKTDVILFDLARLRHRNVDLEFVFMQAVAQARDQHLIHVIPSDWSVSLNDISVVYINQTSSLKMFRMYSPSTLLATSRASEYLRHLYASYDELNENLLKRGTLLCGPSELIVDEKPQSFDPTEECYDIRREGLLTHRTHLFFLPYEYTPYETDVTLITQVNIDRLANLESICRHWDGPMSVAIYLSAVETKQFLCFIASSPCLMRRVNIGFHVVFKEGVFYPVNYLRNVALSQATTAFVYLTDGDFVPAPILYEFLIRFLSEGASSEHRKTAYVVPAFETVRHGVDCPLSKREVIAMMHRGRVQPFDVKTFTVGHNRTDFRRWLDAEEPYEVKWEMYFEPFLVVSLPVQKYDERFVGYGMNKISHAMELHAQGYEFVVLPEVFMVHLFHSRSVDKNKYLSDGVLTRCIVRLVTEFAQELAEKYDEKWEEN